MISEKVTQKTIRDYLLGVLDDKTTDGLDEISITDAAFADRVAAEQYEIVDEWISGQLDPVASKQFEAVLVRSPVLKEKVEFSRVMAAASQSAAVAERSIDPSFLQRLSALVPRFAYGLAVAVILIVFVGTLIFLLREDRGAEVSIATPPGVEIPTADADKPTPSSGDSPLLLTPDVNIASSDSDAEPERSDKNRSKASPRVPRTPSVIALVLTPPTRGSGEMRSVRLKPGVEFIDLNAQTDAEPNGRVHIEIADVSSGKTIWRSAPVEPAAKDGQTIISVRVPVLSVRSGIRSVRLVEANAERSILEEHIIKIIP